MPTVEPRLRSGWLDDVAAVAILGGSPVTLAVCRDLGGTQEARQWLLSAIPSLADASVEEVSAHSLWSQLQASPSAGRTAWIVYDAAEGNDEELGTRWKELNLLRERLTELLRSREPRHSVVFLTTVRRMPEIVRHAPDLIAVSQLVTVSEEPFAVDSQDIAMMERFQQSRFELEARHGLSTHELVRRLLAREPTGVPEPDLSRWRSLAQSLREVLG